MSPDFIAELMEIPMPAEALKQVLALMVKHRVSTPSKRRESNQKHYRKRTESVGLRVLNPSYNKTIKSLKSVLLSTLDTPSPAPPKGGQGEGCTGVEKKVAGKDKKKAGNLEEVLDYAKTSNIPAEYANDFWLRMEGSGWRNRGEDVKSWKATFRRWFALGFLRPVPLHFETLPAEDEAQPVLDFEAPSQVFTDGPLAANLRGEAWKPPIEETHLSSRD